MNSTGLSRICILDLFNGNVEALFDDKKFKILTFPLNISRYWIGTIISEHLLLTLQFYYLNYSIYF